MQGLCVLIFASLLSVQALIMPLSKSDGSLDIPSLLSHISLLEQTIENKASQSDVSKLESELQTALMDQKVTQTKLDTALEELKEFSNMKTELAVLQRQIQSENSQCTCGSSGNVGGQPAQDLSSLRADVSTLKSEVKQLQSPTNQTDVNSLSSDLSTIKSQIFQLQSQGSSVYTRWGRTSCPPGNNELYKGSTAGSYYIDKGGSAAMLCLPQNPIYSNHTLPVNNHQTSQIWGTEFDHLDQGMPFSSLPSEDMPCAVCESNRATSIMVPARNACYQGWTREYSGYLMAGFSTHSQADYICVDSDAEAIPGGHETKYGSVLYPVESKCGSLVCPPYVDGKIVTCVLCSK